MPYASSKVESTQKPEVIKHNELQPSQDLLEYVKQYARDKPDVAALWCFGLGFVIGWKLKPW